MKRKEAYSNTLPFCIMMVLVDRARKMIGYWHHNFRLPVRPSVCECDAVHCG